MNTRMILPATIAAGLHALLLGWRSEPATPGASIAEDPIAEWQPIVMPVLEDESEKIVRTDLDDLPPPPPDIPRQADYPATAPVDPGTITIVVLPTPPTVGTNTNFIPANAGLPDGSIFADGPVDVGLLDNDPRAVLRHAPPTPRGFNDPTATVTVEFIVGKDGKVINVQIVNSTNAMLEEPCLRTVRRWRFEPGLRKNLPVAFRVQQTFVFTTQN